MDKKANLLMPRIATVKKIIKETPNIISIQLVPDDKEFMKNLEFEPGQVGQISVFGAIQGIKRFTILSISNLFIKS